MHLPGQRNSEQPGNILGSRISRGFVCFLMQVVAHSVGTWTAYEFLMLARSKGLAMPKHVFMSAMASPDIPVRERPWRVNANLSEEEFKVSLRFMTDVQCTQVGAQMSAKSAEDDRLPAHRPH